MDFFAVNHVGVEPASQVARVDEFLASLALETDGGGPASSDGAGSAELEQLLGTLKLQREAYHERVAKLESGIWVGEENLCDDDIGGGNIGSGDAAGGGGGSGYEHGVRGRNEYGKAKAWWAQREFCACDRCWTKAWGTPGSEKHGRRNSSGGGGGGGGGSSSSNSSSSSSSSSNMAPLLATPVSLALRIVALLGISELRALGCCCVSTAALCGRPSAWTSRRELNALCKGGLGAGCQGLVVAPCTASQPHAANAASDQLHPRSLLIAACASTVVSCGYCEFGQLALGGAEARMLRAVAGAGMGAISSVGFKPVPLLATTLYQSDGNDGRLEAAPRAPSIPWRVSAISCGGAHCVALGKMSQGEALLAWGSNTEGQCFSCDGQCASCLASGRQLQRGGHWPQRFEHPVIVSSIQRFAKRGTTTRPILVACGGQHSLVAVEVSTTATGAAHWELWASGTNVCGALGHRVGHMALSTAVAVGAAPTAPHPAWAAAAPALPHRPHRSGRVACACEVVGMRGRRCVALAAGASHSLAIVSSLSDSSKLDPAAAGTLFSWGRNTYGACGVGVVAADGGDESGDGIVWEPCKAVFAVGSTGAADGGAPSDVVAVAAGQDHTVAITASGHVFSCGRDGDGQCGRGAGAGELGDAALLTSSASREAAYSSHARSGTTRAWATLGIVPAPAGYNATATNAVSGWGKAAAAGNSHSVVLGLDGECYAFGSARLGQTGVNLGAMGRDSTSLPQLVNVPCGSASVVQVECGADHSFARASDGTLYAWGSNQFGQLGLHRRFDDGIAEEKVGAGEEKLIPTRITRSTLLAHRHQGDADERDDEKDVFDVMYVTCGDDFSFVVCSGKKT